MASTASVLMELASVRWVQFCSRNTHKHRRTRSAENARSKARTQQRMHVMEAPQAHHLEQENQTTHPQLRDLVRFKVFGAGVLALVHAQRHADGMLRVIDAAGQRHRLQPSQVDLRLPQLPGSDWVHRWEDLCAFSRRSEQYALESFNVHAAWQTISHWSSHIKHKLTLRTLAYLLADAPADASLDAFHLHAALLALEHDKAVHFAFNGRAKGKSTDIYFRTQTPTLVHRHMHTDTELSKIVSHAAAQPKAKTSSLDDQALEPLAQRIITAMESESSEGTINQPLIQSDSEQEVIEGLECLALQKEHKQAGGLADTDTGERRQANASTQRARLLLQMLHLPPTAQGAKQVLKQSNIWAFHENVFLRQKEIPVAFSEECVNAAQGLTEKPSAHPDPDEHLRHDLTNDTVITVDKENPNEIDDGFSAYLIDEDTASIRVHIADPTRWSQRDSVLETEARNRACSIYLPEQTIPMLPMNAVSMLMSLEEGCVRHALTIEAHVSLSSGHLRHSSLYASYVQPNENMSTAEANDWLSQHATFRNSKSAIGSTLRLAQRAVNALHTKRTREDGALAANVPKASVQASSSDASAIVTMEPEDQQSPAALLIEELMILAGKVAASFARKHQVPVPFRKQRLNSLPDWAVINACETEESRAAALREYMGSSTMGTEPDTHEALGLSEYIQMSSPLRRYQDMLAHFQLKACLRGDNALPFSKQEMSTRIGEIKERLSSVSTVSQKTRRYWALVWFSHKLHTDTVFRAQLLRWQYDSQNRSHIDQRAFARVLIPEVAYETSVPVKQTFLQPGDELWLQCIEADPQANELKFIEYNAQFAAGSKVANSC